MTDLCSKCGFSEIKFPGPLCRFVKLHRPPPEIRIFRPTCPLCSSSATRRPRWPATAAHINPAAPAPKTITSNWRVAAVMAPVQNSRKVLILVFWIHRTHFEHTTPGQSAQSAPVPFPIIASISSKRPAYVMPVLLRPCFPMLPFSPQGGPSNDRPLFKMRSASFITLALLPAVRCRNSSASTAATFG